MQAAPVQKADTNLRDSGSQPSLYRGIQWSYVEFPCPRLCLFGDRAVFCSIQRTSTHQDEVNSAVALAPWPRSQLGRWGLKANSGTAGCWNKPPCKDNKWCNENIPALLGSWQLLLLMRFISSVKPFLRRALL